MLFTTWTQRPQIAGAKLLYFSELTKFLPSKYVFLLSFLTISMYRAALRLSVSMVNICYGAGEVSDYFLVILCVSGFLP